MLLTQFCALFINQISAIAAIIQHTSSLISVIDHRRTTYVQTHWWRKKCLMQQTCRFGSNRDQQVLCKHNPQGPMVKSLSGITTLLN
jgi:hypothetical protein